MTLDESVHGMRLRVIERAQVQGNVSAVCRELGISRTVCYRWRQRLWRARYGRTRHVDAKEPGELVCLDTFYIGRLKGVGKVWQITACDAATSYGLAGLLPAHDAAAAATFLREVVVPHYRRAGWPVCRVLTDGGPEFQGAFA